MNKINNIVAAIACVFIMACNPNPSNSQKVNSGIPANVTVSEASKLLTGDVLMIDVRNSDELAVQSYNVKNMINIPLDSIEYKISMIPKDKTVILACQRGGRSQRAYNLLKEKGFTNITNMEGGMEAWKGAGLPTKTSAGSR